MVAKQDPADILTQRCPAGLAGNDAVIPGRRQPGRESLGLSRLARTLRALERHEEATPMAAVEVHSPSLAEPRPG